MKAHNRTLSIDRDTFAQGGNSLAWEKWQKWEYHLFLNLPDKLAWADQINQ